MRISFIKDYESQTLTYNTYLEESDSVRIPVSWAAANDAGLNGIKTIIETNYGSKFDVTSSQEPTDVSFDTNILSELKKED